MASNEKKKSHPEQKQNSSPQKKDLFGAQNVFRNDGSFMEMFKRKMEEEKRKKDSNLEDKKEQTVSKSITAAAASSSSTEPTIDSSRITETPVQDKKDTNTKSNCGTLSSQKKTLPFVGKRRGNVPVLKTGAVKKQRTHEEESNTKKDAWSQYMAEVQKYKSQSCQDEDKTRPLVK